MIMAGRAPGPTSPRHERLVLTVPGVYINAVIMRACRTP